MTPGCDTPIYAHHFYLTVNYFKNKFTGTQSTSYIKWGWVTHICVSKLAIIASDNGLSPGRRQAIIWTNAGILLIGPLRTNFSEISIEIHTFSFTKMLLKMSSGKWRPFCLGLNVLRVLRGYQYNMAARMTWCIAVLCLKIYPRRFQTFIFSSKMLNMIDLSLICFLTDICILLFPLSRSVTLVGEKERRFLKDVIKQATCPVKSRVIPQGKQGWSAVYNWRQILV